MSSSVPENSIQRDDVIRPPCTMDDIKGDPTTSIEHDARHIFDLIEDERHLVAHRLYESVIHRIKEFETLYDIIVPANDTTTTTTTTSTSNTTTANGTNGQQQQLQQSSSSDTISNTNIAAANKRKGFALSRISTPVLSETDKKITVITKKMTKADKHKFDVTYKEINHVKRYLDAKKHAIIKLENCARLFKTAKKNLNESSDWTFASKLFGITTSYRREADSSFTVKIEGGMDNVPIFEQLCVLKEVDLYSTWAPFCSSSLSIGDIDKLDNVGWILVGLPKFGLARDGCYRSIGCDNTTEDGSIIIAAQGIFDRIPGTHTTPDDTYLSDDPILVKFDIPAAPTRRGSARMTINKLEAMICVKSPTAAETKVVVNVNPNLNFVPPILIEFVMKHMMGVLLSKLQVAAKKITTNPIHNQHARLMRNEKYAFYHDWLIPKVENICRMNGWDVPEFAAFNLTPQQLLDEQRYIDKHGGYTIKRPRSTDEDDTCTELSLLGDANNNNGAMQTPSDLVSELSSKDGFNGGRSIIANNPISYFLREQEEKVRQRKEAAISAGRRRTAQLLKPKELTTNDYKRLAQLKRAKHQRLGLPLSSMERSASLEIFGESIEEDEEGDEQPIKQQQQQQNGNIILTDATVDTIRNVPASRVSTTTTTLKVTLPRIFTSRLLHDIRNEKIRFGIILIFISIMFAVLHVDYWIQLFESYSLLTLDKYNDVKWYTIVLQDLGVVLYMFAFCSIPHYYLCDIALVYTFDSLQLGSKSGLRIKQYYIDNANLAMALLSFGIVLVSIIKSFWLLSLRYLYTIMMSYTTGIAQSIWKQICSLIPEIIPAIINRTVTVVMSSYVYLILSNIVSNLYWLLFRSNLISRGIEAFVIQCWRIPYNIMTILFQSLLFTQDVDDDIKQHGILYSSWRRDAFDTARSLFSYTAVFLLSILVLFTLSAKSSTKQLDSTTPKKYTTKYSREVSSLSLDGIPSEDSGIIIDNNQVLRTPSNDTNFIVANSRSTDSASYNNNNTVQLQRTNTTDSKSNNSNDNNPTNAKSSTTTTVSTRRNITRSPSLSRYWNSNSKLKQ